MNKMKEIQVEKLTLNVGAGKESKVLERGVKLLENISGKPPVKTKTYKRIASWGLRPGLPVGCKITVRGEKAKQLIKRLLGAKDHILKDSNFDNAGNISFGIHEYIDIPEMEYDPEVGMMGLEVSITLTRPGYRVKTRRLNSAIGKKHLIKQEEAIKFMKDNFEVKLGVDEDDS